MMTSRLRKPTRRRFLGCLAAGTMIGSGLVFARAGKLQEHLRIKNSCISALPESLLQSQLLAQAWQGLDTDTVWDCHVHLAGTGDSGSGIEISPTMNSPLYPVRYLQRLFYMNAGCANSAPGQVDASYVARLQNMLEDSAPTFKLMLLAFDRTYDSAGHALPDKTAFYIPNAYARDVARAAPQHFEWVCSVHPCRKDAVDALQQAAAEGARAVKWLPSTMGIDPASPACDALYRAMAALDMPLITHGGEEKAVHGADMYEWNNPLRLRRALEHGVRVVVAHCATHGKSTDLDQGQYAPQADCFALFVRMLEETANDALLFGDISAITLRNRKTAVLRTLLENTQWHTRLLYGSDYPLPGIVPLISAQQLAWSGLLDAAMVPQLKMLQHHNPLLFDFVLKRLLQSNGCRFAPCVFETRRFFDPLYAPSSQAQKTTTPSLGAFA